MFINFLKNDIKQNKGNRKGKIIVIAYRLTNIIYYHNSYFVKVLGYPIRKIRSLIFKYIMGIEIPEQTKIGKGLCVWHGNGLIIHPEVVIGDNVLLRHTTTIGNKFKGSGTPVIGNNVEIGAHVIIIGNIKIGNNVTIGAGTLINKSIPDFSFVYGNPLVIKKK